jgi:hypothetical protein
MAKVNVGQDKQARLLAGTGTIAGTSGTATSTTATSLTNTGASWTVNGWAGRYIFAANRVGVVISNTATVATIDLWRDPATPTGAAGSTPSGTSTASGGLIRQAAAYAHTTSATTYTLTGSYTANGSDSLPVTIAKIGTFDTLTGATGIMLHETLLSATATLSASGDQLTVTQTVTM